MNPFSSLSSVHLHLIYYEVPIHKARKAWVGNCFDLAIVDSLVCTFNFVDDEWVPQHVMVNIFKVVDTFGVAFAEVIKRLLNEFGLMCMLAY